jgi:hypothetical protein
MIIRDTKKETANKFEKPSLKKIEVVIAETRAAWLDGIPPVRQVILSRISLPFLRFVLSNSIAVLTTWARNQLVSADKTMGFSTKALTDSVRSDIAKDIIVYNCPGRGNCQDPPP